MFNFSEFCKEKKCEHYKEWSVQAGKDGMVRCCELVGASFYITTVPDNCVHLEEITARQVVEKAKHETWKKLTKRTPKEEIQAWVNRSAGIQKKYKKDDIL